MLIGGCGKKEYVLESGSIKETTEKVTTATTTTENETTESTSTESVTTENETTESSEYETTLLSKEFVEDYFYYGKDGNGEPISWLALDGDDDCIIAISQYVVDSQPYNIEQDDITWEKCSLRKWLNSDFYNGAFSKEEKNIFIMEKLVV